MKILFLSRLFYPHIGGVEKQVAELSKRLIKKGFDVTVATEKFQENLKERETINGTKVIRLSYPRVRFLGLIYIWFWFFRNIWIIREADIVHAHSIFIWYWPFRFIFPKKPAYVTFHGWEGIYPVPWKNKIIRKIDAFLARKNIAISDYLEKYYGFKADEISYTAVEIPKKTVLNKDFKKLVYVGRLDKDTGLEKILAALGKLKGYKVDFCGDGPLRKKCEKYGEVHGFVNPAPFLARSFVCLSPGVTSILEALAYKCLVVTTYNNPLKKDYLLLSPFSNWIVVRNSVIEMAAQIKYFLRNPGKAEEKISKAYGWVKTQNWENEVNKYQKLWEVK